MSILAEIQAAIEPLGVPIETGVFTDAAPARYIVVVPLTDAFDLHADNAPGVEVQEARLSLFSQGSYTAMKSAVTKALLAADFTITERRYIGYETDTGYHHYNVDVAKYYEMED